MPRGFEVVFCVRESDAHDFQWIAVYAFGSPVDARDVVPGPTSDHQGVPNVVPGPAWRRQAVQNTVPGPTWCRQAVQNALDLFCRPFVALGAMLETALDRSLVQKIVPF